MFNKFDLFYVWVFEYLNVNKLNNDIYYFKKIFLFELKLEYIIVWFLIWEVFIIIELNYLFYIVLDNVLGLIFCN